MLVMLKYIVGIIIAGLVFAYGAQAIQKAGESTTDQLTRALKVGTFVEAPPSQLHKAMARAPSTAGPKASYDTDSEKAQLLAIASSIGALVACKLAGEYDAEAVSQAAYERLRAIFIPHESADNTPMGQLAQVTVGAMRQSAFTRTAGKPKVTDGKLSGVDVSTVRGEEQCKVQEEFLRTKLQPGEILDFVPPEVPVPAKPAKPADEPAETPLLPGQQEG